MRASRRFSSSVRPGARGFTLLELVVAFALLALFVMPMLQLVHEARVRAHRYSLKREVQNLAQRKLFERIYYYSEETVLAGEMQDMSGTFEAEDRPDWEWEIAYPEIVSQGEQVLLQYTIRVFVPQMGEEKIGGGGMGRGMSRGMGGSSGPYGFDYDYNRPASFEMTTWTFPSEFWYEEQEDLAARGVDTGFYGGLDGEF